MYICVVLDTEHREIHAGFTGITAQDAKRKVERYVDNIEHFSWIGEWKHHGENKSYWASRNYGYEDIEMGDTFTVEIFFTDNEASHIPF